MFPYICVLQILTHLRCTIYKYVCHSFLFTAKAAVSREAIPFNLQSLKVWGSINVVVTNQQHFLLVIDSLTSPLQVLYLFNRMNLHVFDKVPHGSFS